MLKRVFLFSMLVMAATLSGCYASAGTGPYYYYARPGSYVQTSMYYDAYGAPVYWGGPYGYNSWGYWSGGSNRYWVSRPAPTQHRRVVVRPGYRGNVYVSPNRRYATPSRSYRGPSYRARPSAPSAPQMHRRPNSFGTRPYPGGSRSYGTRPPMGGSRSYGTRPSMGGARSFRAR
ncbi:MAG: hypothetical protein IPJ88_06545 [Myxococcales bacterium]|nr:MAG: hypothetical protein IPJ88_06545 [Myxococcales bacterium]